MEVKGSPPAPPPPPGEPPAQTTRRVPVPPELVRAAAAQQRAQNGALGGRKRPASWGSRDIGEYLKLETIGQGTYGHVYKASEKTTGEIVALKKIKMDNEKEGFPITAIREIKILKSLRHENIVDLKEIVTSKAPDGRLKHVYMVFEYLDHDLAGLLDSPEVTLTEAHTKCYMKQLLNGVHYMHRNKILHRDIKGSNLLINNNGYLKIADWGLARSWYEQQARYTLKVITLWYRPPELLMGCQKYGPAVDLWSAGCIFAELLHKQPILKGTAEVDQLRKIFDLCGDPTEESWPGVARECPDWPMHEPKPGVPPKQSRLRQRFSKWAAGAGPGGAPAGAGPQAAPGRPRRARPRVLLDRPAALRPRAAAEVRHSERARVGRPQAARGREAGEGEAPGGGGRGAAAAAAAAAAGAGTAAGRAPRAPRGRQDWRSRRSRRQRRRGAPPSPPRGKRCGHAPQQKKMTMCTADSRLYLYKVSKYHITTMTIILRWWTISFVKRIYT
ncbi:unnamed protein product [Heterosigma akashiwo]